jgi:hypothetical protein
VTVHQQINGQISRVQVGDWLLRVKGKHIVQVVCHCGGKGWATNSKNQELISIAVKQITVNI